MNPSHRDDPLWRAAWDWVIREHEQQLDQAARAELVEWLKAHPAHLRNYEEAHRIWLAAGLVPFPESRDADGAPDKSKEG